MYARFAFSLGLFYVIQSSALSVGHPVTFDDDVLGLYAAGDFSKDWGKKPNSSSGQGKRLYIVEDKDNPNDRVLEVTYLANQVGGNSAMTFDAPLGKGYEHLFLQYKVKFSNGFTWVKGGKLPGLTSLPDSPTGCITNDTFDGFSSRYMWREEGLLYGYVYNPEKIEDCGDYYPTDANFYFQAGVWYTLKQEIFIGNPNEHNGYIKAWVNDKPVLDIENIMLRRSADILIDSIKMDTFFGGSDPATWAPATNQNAYFNDFIVSTEDIPSNE